MKVVLLDDFNHNLKALSILPFLIKTLPWVCNVEVWKSIEHTQVGKLEDCVAWLIQETCTKPMSDFPMYFPQIEQLHVQFELPQISHVYH
jgi:hypothetical protein